MKNFTKETLLDLFPNSLERTYPSGQIVMYQGDQPAHIFFICSGSFKYYDVDQTGSEKILAILGKNHFLPIFYAFGSFEEIHYFYSTLEETHVLLIPIEDFKKLISENAQICNMFFRWFVTEVEFLVERIKSLERSDAKSKIIETLRYLAAKHSISVRGGWCQVAFPLSHQTLADMTGLSRETVSISMREIENSKLIRYKKQLQLEVHKKKLDLEVSS